MRIALLAALAALGLSAGAFAADDPSIQGQQRAGIKAAMSQHIDAAKYRDEFVMFDAVEGGMRKLRFDNLHEGVVRKGEFFVSCADFYDGRGRLYDLDFLVVEEDGEYRVLQSLIHKIDDRKRMYHVEY